MQPVIYDVAISADGYIAGPADDIRLFPHAGPVVDAYRRRLGTYAVALMGRRTYEFGYAFGLEPGANPYPHMRSFVISRTLALPEDAAVEVVRAGALERIDALRRTAPGPLYLCGGGALAGWMLDEGRIDILRLKRAPVFYGGGVRVFGESRRRIAGQCTSSEAYGEGIVYQEFHLT